MNKLGSFVKRRKILPGHPEQKQADPHPTCAILIPLIYNIFIKQGSRMNNLCIQALRLGSGLADPTEQNRRRSIATLRILRVRIGQRWPKSEMHQCASYLFASPKGECYPVCG